MAWALKSSSDAHMSWVATPFNLILFRFMLGMKIFNPNIVVTKMIICSVQQLQRQSLLV